MSGIFNVIYIIAAVLVLFGAAVFVHELGHFLVARWCGLKVLEFAIGFGPKIFGWKRDGIQYSWRLIPAGGYVKLPQMVTSEALEGSSDGEKIPPAPPLAKIAVAVAGPFMNVVFGFVLAGLIYFVGLPVAVNPPIIGQMDTHSPEYKMGIREGDVVVNVDGQTVKAWQDVQLFAALARTNVVAVVTERDHVLATNYLTASVNEAIGLKTLNLDPRDHAVIAEVQTDSPAARAGMKANDKVISFAGVAISGQQQFIDLIRKCGGKECEVVLQRDNKLVTVKVTPKIIDPEKKTGQIGAIVTNDSTLVYRVMKPGPKPWELVLDVCNKTLQTFGALLHHKQTGVGAKDLSGPVGILTMLAAWVNTDYRLALNFLVLLNVNLAVINLLPFPVLDGGHIFLALVEKVRRRPISQKFMEYTTTAFAVVLISFMLYVTFFDLQRFSLFRAMFKKDIHIEQSDEPTSSVPANK